MKSLSLIYVEDALQAHYIKGFEGLTVVGEIRGLLKRNCLGFLLWQNSWGSTTGQLRIESHYNPVLPLGIFESLSVQGGFYCEGFLLLILLCPGGDFYQIPLSGQTSVSLRASPCFPPHPSRSSPLSPWLQVSPLDVHVISHFLSPLWWLTDPTYFLYQTINSESRCLVLSLDSRTQKQLAFVRRLIHICGKGKAKNHSVKGGCISHTGSSCSSFHLWIV